MELDERPADVDEGGQHEAVADVERLEQDIVALDRRANVVDAVCDVRLGAERPGDGLSGSKRKNSTLKGWSRGLVTQTRVASTQLSRSCLS